MSKLRAQSLRENQYLQVHLTLDHYAYVCVVGIIRLNLLKIQM
jgi:hypothetical protein